MLTVINAGADKKKIYFHAQIYASTLKYIFFFL